MPIPELSVGLISFGPDRPMRESVAACARHGIRRVGLTRELVASTGIDEAVRILAGEGMDVTGYARAPRFPVTKGDEWATALSEGRRLLDEAARLGAKRLIGTGGGFDPSVSNLDRAWDAFLVGMLALKPEAADCGIALCIEPLHPMYAGERALIFTLKRALEACDHLGLEKGLVVDAYHVWWEPGLGASLQDASGRIAEFHICDWRLPTRSFSDRAMIGMGCIDLAALAAGVRGAGFEGPYELELFSEQDWWRCSPDEVLTTATRNFERLFRDEGELPSMTVPKGP